MPPSTASLSPAASCLPRRSLYCPPASLQCMRPSGPSTFQECGTCQAASASEGPLPGCAHVTLSAGGAGDVRGGIAGLEPSGRAPSVGRRKRRL